MASNSIKLDLSKFKHHSSDKSTTTLVHEKDGHQITLAHKALSPENQKQLAALAKIASSAKRPIDKDEAESDSQQQLADGGEIQTARAGQEPEQEIKKEKVIDYKDFPKETQRKNREFDKQDKKHKKPVKLAEGGDPQIPAALSPDAPPAQEDQQQAVQAQPAEDPSLADKREIYNQQVMANNPNLNVASPTGGKVGDSMLFGKDKEPAQFDPRLWQNAEQIFAEQKAENASNVQQNQQKIVQENLVRAQAGLPQMPVPDIPDGPQIPGSEANPPQQKADELPQAVTQAADAKSELPNLDDVQGMMQSGYQDKIAGIMGQANALGKQGQEQADILAKAAQTQADAKMAYKQQYDSLEQERQAHMMDIKNGHIDPNKYWTGDANGNGSHSKIASAIGMILAGFNPTSQPNAAINFLKYQMDQNIEGQKTNLNSDQNLLAANLHQFGNLKDAADMTRLMQADIVHDQLMQAAGKAQSALAKSAAYQAAGDVKMTYAPLQQQFAMRRAMMNLANTGGSSGDPSNTAAAEQMIAYARMTNPDMAKEMESRLIPGVGMAKKPVPPDAQKEILSHQNLQNSGNDLLNYSKKHSNLVPGTAEYNFGVTKAMAFQQQIREGLLGTVFRESEKPLLEKFVNENPAGALKAFSTQPKIRAILESNNNALNTIKQGYGLPVQQPPPQIKTVNGVKYMRGPNGQAIPVK